MKRILLTAAFVALGVVGCNKQEAGVTGKDGKVLTLTAPKSGTINPGDTASVKLSITRKQFDGPVTIEFAQLPTGVTVVESDLTIPKGVTEKTFTLKAADSATGKGHAIKVSASAEGMTDGPLSFVLDVTDKKVVGVDPKAKEEALTLTPPKTVSINPGDTASVKLSITRKQFDGPVTIEFAQLPTGVTVVDTDLTIPKGVTEKTFTLKAADSATGKGHAIKVSASGDGMKVPPAEFVLNVDKKGATLEQKRKDLEKDVRASLDETNKEIEKLEARAKDAKGPAKADADAALGKLRQSRDDLDKRLKESQTTTEEAWDNFSTGLHNAAVDLKKSTKEAWEKMKN